jgi:hypothetical protein
MDELRRRDAICLLDGWKKKAMAHRLKRNMQ